MNFTSIFARLLIPFRSEALQNIHDVLSLVLIILMFVAALASVVLVMMQPGNSQGIDGLTGSSETFYGKNKGKSTESLLKRLTSACLIVLAVLAVIFFVLQGEWIWT